MGNVGVEQEFAAGSVRAVGTLEGLFARVPLHVILQRREVRKARGAVRALVRLVTCVGVSVVLQVREQSGRVIALGAKVDLEATCASPLYRCLPKWVAALHVDL